MFLYLIIGQLARAEEPVENNSQLFLGAGATSLSINSEDAGYVVGGHLQFRRMPTQSSFYFDLSFDNQEQPSDDLLELLQEIADNGSGDENSSLDALSWNRHTIASSIGWEMPVGIIGDNGFLRLGGEFEADIQPGMHTQLAEQLSIASDFTDVARVGVFADIGYELPIAESTLSTSIITGYLVGVYTSGGDLREEGSGASLEERNTSNGTSFTHASYANDQYFVGTEVYYHGPAISFFLHTKLGVYERSEVSKWYAEQNDNPEATKGRDYIQLGVGIGRIF